MATTYDYSDGALLLASAATQQNVVRQEFQIYKNRLDFSNGILDESADDIAQALAIPAGTTVLTCYLRVITADTANTTVNLGITGGDVDHWGTNLALSATGVVGGLFAPYYFDTADTIDIIGTDSGASVDIDTAVIEIYAICINHAIQLKEHEGVKTLM